MPLWEPPMLGGKRIDRSESTSKIALAVPVQRVALLREMVAISAPRCGCRARVCGEITVI